MNDVIIGKKVKVAWYVEREDGTKKDYFVAGTCIDKTTTHLTLEGNTGDIFTIPLHTIKELRIKREQE